MSQNPIRGVDRASIAAIHDMNEQALPHVNSMPAEYFSSQLRLEQYFRAAHDGDRPVAFLLAMDQSAEYDSLNFLWFRERYERFVYVDRIVVHPDYRRNRLAGALYADLLAWSRSRAPRVACEVNLRPSNEPSLRFHREQGFAPVGSQDTDAGRKTVSLMVREFSEHKR